MTEDVSKAMAPGRGRCVLGEDVEMSRFWGLASFTAALEDVDEELGVLTCVCSRVLTTSRGHVMTPARPPATPPVRSSSGTPISRVCW